MTARTEPGLFPRWRPRRRREVPEYVGAIFERLACAALRHPTDPVGYGTDWTLCPCGRRRAPVVDRGRRE